MPFNAPFAMQQTRWQKFAFLAVNSIFSFPLWFCFRVEYAMQDVCVCVCVRDVCAAFVCVSVCLCVCVCVLFMCCWLYHVHICAWSQPGAIFVRQTAQVAMDEGAAADDAGAGAVGVTADKGGKGVGSRNRSRSRKRQLWSRHRDCHLPDRQAWLPARHGALPGCLPLHVDGEKKKNQKGNIL